MNTFPESSFAAIKNCVYFLCLTFFACLIICPLIKHKEALAPIISINSNNGTTYINAENGTLFRIDATMQQDDSIQLDKYIITPKHFDFQQITSLLFSGDTNGVIVENYETNDYFKLKSRNGSQAYLSPGSLTYIGSDQQHCNVGDVLSLAHHSQNGNDMLRLSENDLQIISYGSNTIAYLSGMYTPVLEKYIILDNAYFIGASTHIGSEVHSTQKISYMSFSFVINGIKIYGDVDESVAQTANSIFPPQKAFAEMLISENGLLYLSITELNEVSVVGQRTTCIDIEKVCYSLFEKYSLIYLSNEYIATKFYIEYIPFTNGKTLSLVPYWCAIIEYRTIGIGEPIDTSTIIVAERFNAFTGRDLAYGG